MTLTTLVTNIRHRHRSSRGKLFMNNSDDSECDVTCGSHTNQMSELYCLLDCYTDCSPTTTTALITTTPASTTTRITTTTVTESCFEVCDDDCDEVEGFIARVLAKISTNADFDNILLKTNFSPTSREPFLQLERIALWNVIQDV